MTKTKPNSKPKQPRDPQLRKQSGPHGDRAFVELPDPGRTRPVRVYLGAYSSLESKSAYHRILAEWESNGRRLPAANRAESAIDTTIVELCDAFLTHAESYYRKVDGTPTGTIWNYKAAMRFLKNPYGATGVAEFTVLSLEAVRMAMVRAGWCRRSVNQGIHLVRGIFRWGVSKRIVPVATYNELQTLPSLEAGRCDARESAGVRPVAGEIVTATVVHLSPTVRAMVEVQRLTGMRPAEVCLMRTQDVKTKGPVWEYRPHRHKTEHHGRERVIQIGPQAQSILSKYLDRQLGAFIFRPLDSASEHFERRHEARETPDGQGNEPGTNRVQKPRRAPGERFTTSSYRRAIDRACAKAWPIPDEIRDKPDEVRQWRKDHAWAPNQLRHSYGTRVRRDFGLEAAQVALGHAAANITEVYAERDQAKAAAVALKIG